MTSCRPSGGWTSTRGPREERRYTRPMPLPKPVEALWSELEAVRADILREAEGLSQGQADWKPSEKDWSVGEVVHHLTLAEVATGKLTTKLTREAEAAGASGRFPADLTAFKPFPAPPAGAADAPRGRLARARQADRRAALDDAGHARAKPPVDREARRDRPASADIQALPLRRARSLAVVAAAGASRRHPSRADPRDQARARIPRA